MKRKGFTLIELLAVIVILAIIALISTPIIIGVIEKARRGAFEDSAYGVLDAAKLYFTDKLADDNSFAYTEIDFNGDMKDFKISGEKPYGGSLLIDDNGKQAIALYDKDQKWCAVKTFEEEKIRIIENYTKCDKDIAENLIINGYGEYGDNTNLGAFTFKDGIYEVGFSNNNPLVSTNFIEVDPTQKYVESLDLKGVSTKGTFYVGLAEYDIDKKLISGAITSFVQETVTLLKQDLKNGDTKVYLEDLSSWITTPHPVYDSVYTGFKFWNYKDSTGYLYPPETYTRNTCYKVFDVTMIDKVENTITLRAPWNGGLYTKGTSVSQSSDGSGYNYGIMVSSNLPASWTHYKNEIQGTNTNGNPSVSQNFRPGTRYIRFMIMGTDTDENTKIMLKNIVFKKVTSN